MIQPIDPRRESDLLAAAIGYARRGWAVVPVHFPVAGLCSCRQPCCPSPCEHPLLEDWPESASTDPATLRSWWRRWPLANVGVVTGRLSGLVVVITRPGLADTVWMDLKPATDCVARTPAGERMTFYRLRPGQNVPSQRVWPDVEVRGDGAFVVVPPSRCLPRRPAPAGSAS
jgi:hypothetical protein